MATKLATYDWNKPSSLTHTDRRSYPWDEWFNGEIWQITHGEDFDANPLMMERIIRTRATSRRAKVQLRHEPLNGDIMGVIVLRRSDVDQPKFIKPRAPKVTKAPAEAKPASKKAPKAKAEPVIEPVAEAPKPSKKAPSKRAKGGVHHPGPAEAVVAEAPKPSKRPKKA